MADRIQLKPEDVINCLSVSGWSGSIFGAPKLTIVCGNCYHEWKTRNYYPLVDAGRVLTAPCPACKKWNKTGLYLDA